jgi:hypothetical protein
MSGNSGTLLYVGGLADEVDEATLSAAFTPFGLLIVSFFIVLSVSK